MRIAIFGSSGSGKSAAALALACKLNLALRGCGDEVKKVAKRKSVPFSELEDADHLAVDSETFSFANHKEEWIIEGRFLDQVLSDLKCPFVLIQLDASTETRAKRLEKRDSKILAIEDVCRFDMEDGIFRSKMYASNSQLPQYILQTDELSVEEVVDTILGHINS